MNYTFTVVHNVMFFIRLKHQAGTIQDPITKYVDEYLQFPYTVLLKRVHRKAYHDRKTYCFQKAGMTKEKSKSEGQIAAAFHVQRWKTQIAQRFNVE